MTIQRCRRAVFTTLLAAAWAARTEAAETLAAPAPDDSKDSIILNEQSYFRQFLTFGLERLAAKPLKEDAEKLFPKDSRGNSELSKLEGTTKKLLAGRGIDWEKTDWRDVAVFHWSRTQCGVDTRGAMMLPTIWPGANWTDADFDDSSWLCQRLGRLTPNRLGTAAYDFNSLMFRGAFYRACFLVPDPEKAQDLTITIRYRGGARILVNGREIARGNLPPGDLNEETRADDYPLEAYVAVEGDTAKGGGGAIADLRDDWAGPAVDAKGKEALKRNCMNQELTQKGWLRIQNLRDRTLGPVKIPAGVLKKGVNVLTIETRTSHYHPWIVPNNKDQRWGVHGGYTNLSWDHCGLLRIEMRSASSSVPSAMERPAGAQIWATDMHNRLWTPDYRPLRAGKETLRFVGARNGTFSGQIGLSTSRELTGLKAAAGDLVSEQGARIPAGAIQVMPMQGQPFWMLEFLGQDRCERVGFNPANPRIGAYTGLLALHRYDVRLPNGGQSESGKSAYVKALTDFQFFDHISATWPEKVPANVCQPLWVYLKVPADAAEGVYAGAVTIQADGIAPLTMPVSAEVIGWRLPDSVDFQTFAQSEQSPYGVAKHYKVDLWSDRHFQLMESSLRQLGRLGDGWVYVAVVQKSELGNKDDAMVKWIRRKDGTLTFDYAIMDRYLALARKCMGKLKVVCFLVMHGTDTKTTTVSILDEASGRSEVVDVGQWASNATRRPLWRAFATALYDHMKTLGLEQAMHWGQAFDDVPDKSLVTMMADATPGVYWTCAGHGRAPDSTFRVTSRAYGVDLGDVSLQGWKNPFTHLLTPRMAGSVICVEGTSTPFTHRVLVDRAIYTGFNGIGRMGADYFDNTWFDGFGGGQWNMVGRPCVQTLWPGKDAIESSARHETMLEGIQEAEARVYLEQTLDRKVLSGPLAEEVRQTLNRHCHETLYIPGGASNPALMDYTGDWQARSRRLYRIAARVSETIGMDVDRVAFGEVLEKVLVPALSRSRLTLVLRNWSGKPRAWKAVAADSWIVPEKPEGTVVGRQELGIGLDGKALKDGAELTGTLNITDVAAGTLYPVKIVARVGKSIEFTMRKEIQFWSGGGSGSEGPKLIDAVLEPVLNVPVGGSDAQEYALVSRAADKQAWQIAGDCPWLTAEPAAGEIAAGATVRVKISARPKDAVGAFYEPTLTLTALGGAVSAAQKIKVYVIPPYQPPAVPAGEAVYLNDLDHGKLMKRHVYAGFSKDDQRPRPWFIGADPVPAYQRREDQPVTPTTPYTMAKQTFTRGLWVAPYHETIYNIEGAGFTAFAAEVGFWDNLAKNRYSNLGAVVSCEVYVDGKLRAQSSLMKFGDAPRLLVVDKLAGARQVKLVTRRDDLVNDWYTMVTWGDPRFIKSK